MKNKTKTCPKCGTKHKYKLVSGLCWNCTVDLAHEKGITARNDFLNLTQYSNRKESTKRGRDLAKKNRRSNGKNA